MPSFVLAITGGIQPDGQQHSFQPVPVGPVAYDRLVRTVVEAAVVAERSGGGRRIAVAGLEAGRPQDDLRLFAVAGRISISDFLQPCFKSLQHQPAVGGRCFLLHLSVAQDRKAQIRLGGRNLRRSVFLDAFDGRGHRVCSDRPAVSDSSCGLQMAETETMGEK